MANQSVGPGMPVEWVAYSPNTGVVKKALATGRQFEDLKADRIAIGGDTVNMVAAKKVEGFAKFFFSLLSKWYVSLEVKDEKGDDTYMAVNINSLRKRICKPGTNDLNELNQALKEKDEVIIKQAIENIIKRNRQFENEQLQPNAAPESSQLSQLQSNIVIQPQTDVVAQLDTTVQSQQPKLTSESQSNEQFANLRPKIEEGLQDFSKKVKGSWKVVPSKSKKFENYQFQFEIPVVQLNELKNNLKKINNEIKLEENWQVGEKMQNGNCQVTLSFFETKLLLKHLVPQYNSENDSIHMINTAVNLFLKSLFEDNTLKNKANEKNGAGEVAKSPLQTANNWEAKIQEAQNGHRQWLRQADGLVTAQERLREFLVLPFGEKMENEESAQARLKEICNTVGNGEVEIKYQIVNSPVYPNRPQIKFEVPQEKVIDLLNHLRGNSKQLINLLQPWQLEKKEDGLYHITLNYIESGYLLGHTDQAEDDSIQLNELLYILKIT